MVNFSKKWNQRIFALYNLTTNFLTITAACGISGLSFSMSSNSKGNEGAYWVSFGYIMAFLYVAILFYDMYAKIWRNSKASWWSLAITIEDMLENISFKRLSVFMIGVAVILQLLGYFLCGESDPCSQYPLPAFYVDGSNQTWLPYSTYTKAYQNTLDKVCDWNFYNSNEQGYINSTLIGGTEYISFKDYFNTQDLCVRIADKCPDYCSDKSTLISLIITLVITVLGAQAIYNYDGPFYETIKQTHPAFDKLELKLGDCFGSSSEILLTLPVLCSLHCEAQKKATSPEDLEKIFNTVKETRSDLPWDMTEKFTNDDYKALNQILNSIENNGEGSRLWILNIENTAETKQILLNLFIKKRKMEPYDTELDLHIYFSWNEKDPKFKIYIACEKALYLDPLNVALCKETTLKRLDFEKPVLKKDEIANIIFSDYQGKMAKTLNKLKKKNTKKVKIETEILELMEKGREKDPATKV